MKQIETGELWLNEEDVYAFLKNRPPLLMLHSAKVFPGKSSVMERELKVDEWFFGCHFPGNPMMPGVLQLETMFQTAAMAIKTLENYRDKTSNENCGVL